VTSFCSCGAIACRLPSIMAEKIEQETWTGLVLASMPDKSWLIVWGQSGKASIHLRWLLKFVEMLSISDQRLMHCMHACVNIVRLMASSVPPSHDTTSAVPLQNNLQLVLPGAIQQNLQPVILPWLNLPPVQQMWTHIVKRGMGVYHRLVLWESRINNFNPMHFHIPGKWR